MEHKRGLGESNDIHVHKSNNYIGNYLNYKGKLGAKI